MATTVLKMNKKLVLSRGGLLYSATVDEMKNQVKAEILEHHQQLGYKAAHPRDIAGCCRGMMCMGSQEGYCLLWNPFTGIRNDLPDKMAEVKVYNRRSIYYGLGYDKLHNDFKVVRVIQSENIVDNLPNIVQVYSLKSDDWGKSIEFPHYVGGASSECVNGALHYLVRQNTKKVLEEGSVESNFQIASFDVTCEKYELVPQPHTHGEYFSFVLGELDGDLCMTRKNKPRMRFELWVMKEYGVGDSWTALFHLRWAEDAIGYFFPITYFGSKNQLLMIRDDTICCADLKERTVKPVEIQGTRHDLDKFDQVYVCPQTFAGHVDHNDQMKMPQSLMKFKIKKALRELRKIVQKVTLTNVINWGSPPAELSALSQRLSRDFSEALNGFNDEGWTLLGHDGMDDIAILVNSSAEKLMDLNLSVSNAVMCAKASMLLQDVPPAILLRYLREHRSEWADNTIDAYSVAGVTIGPFSLPRSRVYNFGDQVRLPLAYTIKHKEMLEVVKLEGVGHPSEDMMPRDVLLLQLCSGVAEKTRSELIFALIDGSCADNAPLLPSGFRIIPIDSSEEASSPNRTLDLDSSLEAGSKPMNVPSLSNEATRSMMTIAFEFAFEIHMQENVASMARQYIRSIISTVQRVALALRLHGRPEAHTLAQWIGRSYRCYMDVDLLTHCPEGSESFLESLWHYSNAIMCCSIKALPAFTFANQAGLDMLETTLVALQDITLHEIFDHGGESLYSKFSKMTRRNFVDLQGGIGMSSKGRSISYERAVAWKVLNDEETTHCLCFMFINWSVV